MANKYSDYSGAGALQNTDLFLLSRAPHSGDTTLNTTPADIFNYINTELALGTLSTQNANNVNITGGSATNIAMTGGSATNLVFTRPHTVLTGDTTFVGNDRKGYKIWLNQSSNFNLTLPIGSACDIDYYFEYSSICGTGIIVTLVPQSPDTIFLGANTIPQGGWGKVSLYRSGSTNTWIHEIGS